MSFAGKVWRLLVGIKDALALLFLLLFFAALFAILAMRPNPAAIRDGALLLDLNGVIVEERSPVEPFEALLSGTAPIEEYPVRELRRSIDAAATDARVKAVVLDLDMFLGGGQVHLQEVGEALARVRAAGKPVLAFATAYSDDSYHLAAHASEIWMDPLGATLIAGPGGNRMYYGDLLDKVGINARIFRAGAFKSAGETYSRNSMSDEARRNAQALYDALWTEWQASITKARPTASISEYAADPQAWIERGEGNLGRAALAAKLVDKLDSRRAFEERVAKVAGVDTSGEQLYAHSAFADYSQDVESSRSTGGKAIGIITIAGTIVEGEAGPGTAGGVRIAKVLDDALDDDLAGLVVRVEFAGRHRSCQ